MDLIRTLEEDARVEYESHSDSEAEESKKNAQPTKKKLKLNVGRNHEDFDQQFNFFAQEKDDEAQVERDAWAHMAKFLKKKAKTTLDDKIKRVRAQMEMKDESDEEDDLLSEEDLAHDAVKVKEKDANRKKKKAKKAVSKEEEKEPLPGEDWEEADLTNLNEVTFHSMNLSRPILKAVEAMNFVHPTPVQAATVPVALQVINFSNYRSLINCIHQGKGRLRLRGDWNGKNRGLHVANIGAPSS